MCRFNTTPLILILSICAGLSATTGQAQERHQPLDHRAPTGMAGRWSAIIRPGTAGIPQPVQVRLPSSGTVTFYSGSPNNPIHMAAPAQVGMGVGYVYRFRISDLPEYPGVELYPTVELIDRLHAPANLAQEFPIPVELSEDEIEIVLQDRMVTKVIYLEEPDLAFPVEQETTIRAETLKPNENLLQAADQRGRPLAIVRIGGRIPDPRSPTDEFFSQSPLMLTTP
ncbi:hypothetical protein SH661x_000700 [Planctomicrobium sp. SH661]|uniref:hypothetical protein n=1 Tax=Planctomicrobium sp. SH661 TaxID=3448124 RepID=UPI003F5C5FDE